MANMKCPQCESTSLRKNGHRSGRQNYLCKNCGRQFLEPSSHETLPTHPLTPVPVSHNGSADNGVALDTVLSSVGMLPVTTQTERRLDSISFTAQELLQCLRSPQLLESPSFKEFVKKIHELKEPPASSTETGIAILLLDAENLKLDVQIEKFLADTCIYPLQVKIAFANWRNPTIGKQDAELYERGYQLVHVPSGPSSADGKMIALGSSIFLQYPNVKEVFVCSSDGILTHLCNELQNKGLTVYWVRRQDNILHVENRNSGQVNHYSIAVGVEIPPIEGFVNELEELIKAEHKSITDRIARLSTVTTLFQERRHITLNANRSNGASSSAPEQDEINPNIEEELTQRIVEQSYVDSTEASGTIFGESAKIINSIKVLETVLIEMIHKMMVEDKQDYVSVNKLKILFQLQYNESADAVVKRFHPKSSLIKLLRNRTTLFRLTLVENQYEVALAV